MSTSRELVQRYGQWIKPATLAKHEQRHRAHGLGVEQVNCLVCNWQRRMRNRNKSHADAGHAGHVAGKSKDCVECRVVRDLAQRDLVLRKDHQYRRHKQHPECPRCKEIAEKAQHIAEKAQREATMISRQQLVASGWTRTEISKLGEPDYVQNFRTYRGPAVRYYYLRARTLRLWVPRRGTVS